VCLPASGYGTTQFDMTDEQRGALVNAGREAMLAFLGISLAEDAPLSLPSFSVSDSQALTLPNFAISDPLAVDYPNDTAANLLGQR